MPQAPAIPNCPENQMQIDLSGKTALVTGSTEGIGLGIAKGLAGAGAHVIVNGRNANTVSAVAAALGNNARGIAADLGTAAGIEQLIAAVPHVDILVSNLGIFEMGDFFDIDDAAWDRHWQVNVMAGVRLARAYLPGMQSRNWGRVIILGSESAFNIPADVIHYGVTKAADVALARGLAKRMAGTGVTVNSVLPGPTKTEKIEWVVESMRGSGAGTAEEAGSAFVKQMRPTSIIGRIADVSEVANMVVYLASPLSSATTGASLRVDGGIIETL